MAISLESISRNRAQKAPRIVLYGVQGIGKTEWAVGNPKRGQVGAPAPVVQPVEDGLTNLNHVDAFPLVKSYSEAIEGLGVLYSGAHEFQTLVVDTLDWLERLIWDHTAKAHGKQSIEDFGYGKGYVEAVRYWRDYIEGLDALRNDKNMTIILIAHCGIKRFNDPLNEPYDQYKIKLHESAAGLFQEWADCVFFANEQTVTQKTDVGFKKTVNRGVTTGQRLIHTTQSPAYYAKNRFSLPTTLDLNWQAFSDALSPSAPDQIPY